MDAGYIRITFSHTPPLRRWIIQAVRGASQHKGLFSNANLEPRVAKSCFAPYFFFIYLSSACFVGAEQKITAQRGGATGVRSEKRLASAHTTLVLTQFPCYYFRPRRIDLSIERRRLRDNFDRPKNLMPCMALWLAEAKMVIFLLSEWQIWTMNHSFIAAVLTARAYRSIWWCLRSWRILSCIACRFANQFCNHSHTTIAALNLNASFRRIARVLVDVFVIKWLFTVRDL